MNADWDAEKNWMEAKETFFENLDAIDEYNNVCGILYLFMLL